MLSIHGSRAFEIDLGQVQYMVVNSAGWSKTGTMMLEVVDNELYQLYHQLYIYIYMDHRSLHEFTVAWNQSPAPSNKKSWTSHDLQLPPKQNSDTISTKKNKGFLQTSPTIFPFKILEIGSSHKQQATFWGIIQDFGRWTLGGSLAVVAQHAWCKSASQCRTLAEESRNAWKVDVE